MGPTFYPPAGSSPRENQSVSNNGPFRFAGLRASCAFEGPGEKIAGRFEQQAVSQMSPAAFPNDS